MADLKERADKYSLGKSNEMFDKAIAQAYIDGYKEGYKDCKADNSISQMKRNAGINVLLDN